MATINGLSGVSMKHVGIVAATAGALLYMMFVVAGEAARSFAQDSETAIVSVTVASGLGLACDANNDGSNSSGETLNIGVITYTGDTGAYSDARAVKCYVVTNNSAGYTLAWKVATGSGGNFTGHLVNQDEEIIAAFGTGSSNNYTKTWELNPLSNANDSRWGGRVSSTSSGVTAGNMDFGTDASSEKWARVSTGAAAVTIRTKSSQSQSGKGDMIKIGFRAQVGATKSQDTGVYKATVTFTATAL